MVVSVETLPPRAVAVVTLGIDIPAHPRDLPEAFAFQFPEPTANEVTSEDMTLMEAVSAMNAAVMERRVITGAESVGIPIEDRSVRVHPGWEEHAVRVVRQQQGDRLRMFPQTCGYTGPPIQLFFMDPDMPQDMVDIQ